MPSTKAKPKAAAPADAKASLKGLRPSWWLKAVGSYPVFPKPKVDPLDFAVVIQQVQKLIVQVELSIRRYEASTREGSAVAGKAAAKAVATKAAKKAAKKAATKAAT